MYIVDIPPVADAWAAERVKSARIGTDVRQRAATGADGRHRAAQRVPREPQRARVVHQRLLQPRPKVVDFALETTMHPAHRFADDRAKSQIGPHIVPIVRLRAAARDHGITLVGEDVGLRSVAVVKANFRKAHAISQLPRLGPRMIRQVR